MLPSVAPRAAVVDAWSHEPNLDFLRTIAVLCVVVRHVLNMFSLRPVWWVNLQALGIFGVLMFFVHTSLVLMISMEKSRRTSNVSTARFWSAFLVRRFFRIYPLSMTAVLIAYFLCRPFADSVAVRAGIASGVQLRDLWANLFLVQDLVVLPSVLAPLWSLPAEVQMYVVLPLLFLVVQRKGVRAIGWIVWPMSVVVAVVAWKLNTRLTVARYAPCFVAGVGCFGLLRTRRPLAFACLPAFIGALLLAYMVAYSRFGLQAGLGILATLCLAAVIPLVATTRSIWLKRASQKVAQYSYGVYLFHVPCIWIAFGKLRWLGTAGSCLALVLLVAVASVAAYHLIEEPFIRLGKRVAGKVGRPAPQISGDRVHPAPSQLNAG